MNTSNYIKAFFGITWALAAAGCASTGVENTPHVVQAVQIGDDALSCGELKSQIDYANGIVAKLDQEIEHQKTMARTNDASGAINSYLGKSSLLNSLAASFSRDSAEDMREVKDSHQKRRDILMQQYMYKQCSLTAQS